MADFNQIKQDIKNRMDKTLESLKSDFSGLRAGRAHASLLDGIMVESYGSMVPLSQVGTISVPDARTLSISVWDKSTAKAVEKAIMESDLGLNPASDGQLIRIPIPPLSEERRKELVKVAGKYAEQNKVAIRNLRRDGIDGVKKLKKDNLISEDEEKRFENEIQMSGMTWKSGSKTLRIVTAPAVGSAARLTCRALPSNQERFVLHS